MWTEPWTCVENPSKFWEYNWDSDDLPARKFYLFIVEIGRRLRHLMTDVDAIHMIDLCEQCAEGQITEDELSELSYTHRPDNPPEEEYATSVANNLYWWVADRYKVKTRGVCPAANAFAVLAAVDAKLIPPRIGYNDLPKEHPTFAVILEQTEMEWGALVRDIYGPNPHSPVSFSPSWRTDTAVTLARQMYESRDFGAMPILADALQDAGCDNDDILNHCRDTSLTHVRGCWVVDLVLDKA